LSVVTDGTQTSYTVAERLFYSAIAEFSAMLTADTQHTYKTLLRALSKNVSEATTANRASLLRTYNALRRFARCQWSPLAVPLPFADTFQQREIYRCDRRQQVRASTNVERTYYYRLAVTHAQETVLGSETVVL